MTLTSFSSLSFKTGCFFERFAVAKVWKRVHDHDLSPIVYVTLRLKKKAGLVRFARRREEMAATAGEDKNGGPALYER